MWLAVFSSIPGHPTEEPQELATSEDGGHPVAVDPPALLSILFSALLQKSNFSANWDLIHQQFSTLHFLTGSILVGNYSNKRPIKVRKFTL